MGEFYKIQQQLHLLGNIVSDSAAPQQTGRAMCLTTNAHTYPTEIN